VATIVLLHGEPGNGKSFCALVLKSLDCIDTVLHTDEIYTGYIFIEKRDIYRDDLRQQIWAHYLQHRQQIKDGWHAHLFDVVSRDAKRVQRLAVEGWQLFDCHDQLSTRLESEGHQVIPILASGKNYFPYPPQSLDVRELADWLRQQMVGK
jgi:hypothetical protein